MDRDDVKKIVSTVTGSDTVTVQFALAYILGQLCGIEICESGSVDDLDPQQLLKKLGGSNTIDTGQCPISQVFLMSNMTARTKNYKTFDPNGALYHSRRKDAFDDPEKLKTRMKRLQTALAAIHSSQYELPKVSGPSSALLLHGIQLMTDMRGTSDSLLNKLSEDGICRPANVIRVWIQKLADAIEPLTTREPIPRMSHVLCNTADNADFHLFGTCKSVVPGGTILLGIEPEGDSDHFNKEYMRGLGKLSDIHAEQLIATEEEDAVAQEVINNQNVAAIVMAALEYNNIPKGSARSRSSAIQQPIIGAEVTFTYRSEKRQGKVTTITGKNASVTFTDGNRQVTRLIPLQVIDREVDEQSGHTANEQSGPTATENAATTNKETHAHLAPEMFNGERHRFNPSTTSISFILTGLSSKNTETARQVLQQIINQYGEEKFNEAVHVVVADQEFLPTMINDFFSRLREEDNNLPILPALAIGHVMKGLSVSMMSFYKCFFDSILEASGVKVGSPQCAKYYKGTVIRDTNELVTQSIEMAAVAAAHHYLEEVGSQNRILSESIGLTTPFAALNEYFSSVAGTSPDPTARSVIVMDPHTRPMCVTVTDSLKLIAADFQKWARDKWGTTYRDEVGPSGFVKKSPQTNEQQLDPVQQQLSNDIEQDSRFQPFRDMNYFDDGECLGLYSRCKNAGVIGKSSRKDKDTLSKKLYIVEVMRDKEKAIQFGPSRKLPKHTNSTGLVLYDLLFGVERFVLVQGHLLTRVRPRDQESCKRYPVEWLVFFKALTTSTFMRWQPNYQRLTLSFLIQLSLILNHEDKKCIDLALKRIRWTFAVNEWGDSHNCTPVDLLQEYSIVAQTKRIGARNPGAFRNLVARVKLGSYLRLQRIESRGQNQKQEFPQISHEHAARAKEKLRKSALITTFWRSVMDTISVSDDTNANQLEKIQGLGNDNSDVLFADRSRAFFRHVDAVDHLIVSAAAFVKGYSNGFEVALPPRGFSVLRCLHRGRKKTVASKVKSLISEQAMKCKLEAEQSLKEEQHVLLHSSNSMLRGLEKAGDGKSNIYAAILSTLSKNADFGSDSSQIGDGPSKPVVLARTAVETVKLLKQRAKRASKQAPILRYVDVAKDLRRHIPRRNGGNTVNDLARDIICEALQRYYFDGIEMICLCMDVADGMTSLRLIPHKKRGKIDAFIPHGSFSKVKKGTDDLTPYGAISDLLTCGDRHFTELMFDTICNQAKSLEAGEWRLHKRVRKFALAIIGGSTQACVVAGIGGKQHIHLNNDGLSFTCQDVEDRFEQQRIVNAEEGEMMVYAALRATFEMAYIQESGACIDCVVVIDSDDSDSFGGLAMQAIYNLESTCIGTNGKKFLGAIYLHGPQKSVAQVAKLGDVFRTNIHVDEQECPASGRGLEMLIDLIAVYYSLEQDNTLPELPCGHRAISALSVTYTLVNHDYLSIAANSGVTYRSVIAAMKSESYKKEASNYTVNQRSPVNLTRKAVYAGQNHTVEKGYNLSGVLLLMHHVFINRPATKKILLKRYEPTELGDGIKYDVVRAAALLAGEMHPLPDPVALLLYLSCANLVFRRWGVHVYSKTIRTDDELKSTPYNVNMEKGERVMSIQFDLCGMAPTRNALDDRSLHTKLKQSCYGALLPTSESCALIPMPFDPFIETRNAIMGGCGYYPTVKVSAEHLPQGVTQSDTTEQATQLLEEHEVIDSDENNDDDGADDNNDEDEDVDETLLEDDSEHDEEIEDNEY